jgi:hypothetical protein
MNADHCGLFQVTLEDKFTTVDDDPRTGEDVFDRSAVFYMKEQDMVDLIATIEIVQALPKVRFMKEFGQRIEIIKKQFRSVLK